MHRIFAGLTLLLAALGASAQAPVPLPLTGNLSQMLGTPSPYAGIKLGLQNCPSPITITGSSVIVQTEAQIKANASGVINSSVWPNDLIDCNGTTGASMYSEVAIVNGVPSGTVQCYQVLSTQGSWNLNIQQPIACSETPPSNTDGQFTNLNVLGNLTLAHDPTVPLQSATKQYVDTATALPAGAASAGNLRTWTNALATLQHSGSSTQVSVGYIGDSYATSGNITGPLTTALQNQYGAGGLGWIQLYYLNSNNPGVTFTTAGVWIPERNTPTSCGVNLSDVHSSDAVSPARLIVTSTTANVASMTLYYCTQPGGGTFKWWVDSATAITLSAASTVPGIATSTISGLVGSAPHTFQVQILTAGTTGITISGLDARAGANGIVVHNLGSAGSDTSNWTSVDAGLWEAQLALLNPSLVSIMLTPNDQIGGITPAQQYTNLSILIGRIKAALPAVSVVLMPSPQSGLATANNMAAYSSSQSNLAAALGVGYIDVGTQMSQTGLGVWNPLLFNVDTLHPNAVGGAVISNIILAGLNVPLPVGALSYNQSENVVLSTPSSFEGDSLSGYGSMRITSASPGSGSSVVFMDKSPSVLPWKMDMNDTCGVFAVGITQATAAATNIAPPTWGTPSLCLFPTYLKFNKPLQIPAIKSTTGTRYVCVDTAGNIVSSPTACSGT